MKLQPFNLKAALAGSPVATREGVSVTNIRILDSPDHGQIIGGFDGATHEFWYADGVYHLDRVPCSLDLFMTFGPKKITYWVNFYPECGLAGDCAYGFKTREQANAAAHESRIGKARKVVLEVAE